MKGVSHSQLEPLVPKALRVAFYCVLFMGFIVGFGPLYYVECLLALPCAGDFVGQVALWAVLALPLALLVQFVCLRAVDDSSHAVLLFAFFALAGEMLRFYFVEPGSRGALVAAVLMLYALWMLLNLFRSMALELGPRVTAAKRLLAAECVLPLASLLACALLLTPEKMHDHIFVPSVGFCAFGLAFALIQRPDVSAWQGQGPVLGKGLCLGALLLYALMCVLLCFATVDFVCRVGVMDVLLPYVAGLALAVLLARVVAMRFLTGGVRGRFVVVSLLGLMCGGAACFASLWGMGILAHYFVLLLACVLLVPCGALLLVEVSQCVRAERRAWVVMAFGLVLLLAVLAVAVMRCG